MSYTGANLHFKGVLEKCGKRLLAFPCVSVRTSVHLGQIRSHWMDFYEISYLIFFENLSKFQFRLKCGKNVGYVT